MKKSICIIMTAALAITGLMTGCGKNKNPKQEETLSQTVTETVTETTTVKPDYNRKLIAFTFDDGPNSKSTDRILNTLAANNSVATFFTVGYNIDENPSVIKKAYDMGCEIGNHTKGHKYLTKCSGEELREQIDYVNNKIEEITGERPKLCRAPGGFYKGIEAQIGMPLIQWSVDTNDWKYKDESHKNRTAEKRAADIQSIVDHIMTHTEKGSIILMHDIYGFSADVVEAVVPKLREQGYELVTVSQLYEYYGMELKTGNVYFKVEFPEEDVTYSYTPGKFTVNTHEGKLNVRDEASINSNVLAEIPKGAEITVTEFSGNWAKTAYEGVTGWVNVKYILPVESSTAA